MASVLADDIDHDALSDAEFDRLHQQAQQLAAAARAVADRIDHLPHPCFKTTSLRQREPRPRPARAATAGVGGAAAGEQPDGLFSPAVTELLPPQNHHVLHPAAAGRRLSIQRCLQLCVAEATQRACVRCAVRANRSHRRRCR